MSPTPTDLDAILESIRARITGEVSGEVTGDVTGDVTGAVTGGPATAAATAPAPPPAAALPQKPDRLLPTPVVDAAGITVEALLTGLLEPMLRQWLDTHLPEICERIAQQEIRRLTGQSTTPA
jgi:hypothetical protein